ncbi:MAG: MFS transporter [Anaerolineae bacterium]|nr:MFS transporter [Anaerolineae bacterium]
MSPISQNQTVLKRALGVIFCIMLMDIIGINILYPIAPYLVKRYSDEALMVTMLTVIYAAAQFFAAPMMGKLGDRYGRRPVLLVSLLGAAIGYVILGIGGALWVLFLGRLIGGITAGNLSTASAYLADVSSPKDRAKNFGLIGVAWGAGLIVGPALGAVLGQINLAAPAFVAAALSFVNMLLAVFLLPESLPREQRESSCMRANDLNPFTSIMALARLPSLGHLFLALCLFNFAFNAINSTQTLFLIDKFAVQPWQLGSQMVVGGITVAIVQALLVQRCVSRYKEKQVAVASLLGQVFSALAVFFAPVFWLIYPLTVLNSALSTFTFPTIGTLASNSVLPREQGILMGVTTALGSLMGVLGPLCAGFVYDRVMRGTPYWMGAVVFALAAFVLYRLQHYDILATSPEGPMPD